MGYEEARRAAVTAVEHACKLCESVRQTLGSEESLVKDDHSPVTVADYGAQAIVSIVLEQGFPGVPLVAEEDATALRDEAQIIAVWLTAGLFLAFGGGWFATAAHSNALTLIPRAARMYFENFQILSTTGVTPESEFAGHAIKCNHSLKNAAISATLVWLRSVLIHHSHR